MSFKIPESRLYGLQYLARKINSNLSEERAICFYYKSHIEEIEGGYKIAMCNINWSCSFTFKGLDGNGYGLLGVNRQGHAYSFDTNHIVTIDCYMKNEGISDIQWIFFFKKGETIVVIDKLSDYFSAADVVVLTNYRMFLKSAEKLKVPKNPERFYSVYDAKLIRGWVQELTDDFSKDMTKDLWEKIRDKVYSREISSKKSVDLCYLFYRHYMFHQNKMVLNKETVKRSELCLYVNQYYNWMKFLLREVPYWNNIIPYNINSVATITGEFLGEWDLFLGLPLERRTMYAFKEKDGIYYTFRSSLTKWRKLPIGSRIRVSGKINIPRHERSYCVVDLSCPELLEVCDGD